MVKSIFKGVMWAVIATLLFVLGFALVMQWTHLSNAVVKPVMQVIKVLCIFMAVALGLKHAKGKGWLLGGAIGIIYMILTFLIFSMLDGNFTVGLGALSDLLFQTLTGVVSGMVLRLRNKDVEVA